MIKTLLKSVREYKKYTILTPIMVVMDTLFFTLIPKLMASLIDKGITPGDLDSVYKIGLKLLLAIVLMMAFGILGGVFAAKASGGFAKNLRHDVFYKMQDFSFSNVDKFNSSSLVVRLTTDVQRLQGVYQMIIRLAFRAPFSLIFACVMAFTINKKLAMIFLYVIPFIALFLFIIIKVAMPRFEKVYNEYDVLNGVVKENLDGIRVVKAYVREDHQNKKFQKETAFIEKLYKRAYGLPILALPIMLMFVYLVTIIITWFGSKMVIAHSLTTGDLFALVSYTAMALFSLIMLSVVFVNLTVSLASAKRVVEVFEAKSDIRNKSNPVTEVKDGSIKFDHVDFSYLGRKDKLALRDINIDIPSGHKLGIIGGTGSSKSTLVQLLPRLYDVLNGSVKIGGVDVKEYDIKVLRDNVAFVLQKSVLFSGTVRENLKWGNQKATDEQIIEACKIAQADGFINEFVEGYDYIIEQGGLNVSGGQRQRLSIARALLKSPKIIIFDDSTSAVDMATEASIREGLASNLPGLTQVIIAQRITSVKDCDSILVLDDGKIDAIGTHEELLASNLIYQEVYKSQSREDA
ncbi:MAG: ABC transporter ATP-binding protein [Sphaerochaeta sp.]